MKIYIRTDLECVAGVVNFHDYCFPGPVNPYGPELAGRYYDHAKELATLETNAAIEGLIEAGATEFLVLDGHGPGCLNLSLLHPAAKVMIGMPLRAPVGLDESFDAAIMIGQHAMSNADGGHLAHSGAVSRDYWTLNGQEIGEIHLTAMMAGHFGVPLVMLSGDAAGCAEARANFPWVHTVETMVGERRGSSRGMNVVDAARLNVPAIHIAPIKSRQLIRETARQCLGAIKHAKPYRPTPPLELVSVSRPDGDKPAERNVFVADNAIDMINQDLPNMKEIGGQRS